MKDSKITKMFVTNELRDPRYWFTNKLKKGTLGDVMFLQKVYASQEYLENRGKRHRFSYNEYLNLSQKDKEDILHWYGNEDGHANDVGYARNDNGRRLDRVPRIRNAQLFKLSRRDSILNREYKKLCSYKLMGTNVPGVKISFWETPNMELPELKIVGRLSKDMIQQLPRSLAVSAAKARAKRNWPTGAYLPDGSFCKWTKDFKVLVHFADEDMSKVVAIYRV